MSTNSSRLLRGALTLDAVSSGALGLLLVFAAVPLAALLGLPRELLVGAGAILIPFAVFVGVLARRPQVPRAAVWAVVAINLLWVVDSVLLLAFGWVSPGPLGIAFVIAQAVVVGVFAEAQILGLRRTPVLA